MKPRHFVIPLAIFLFVYSITSCTKTTNKINTIYDTTVVIKKDTIVKKDTVTKVDTIGSPKNPVIGQWTGTYTIDGNPSFGSFYFSWSLFPDHSMIERSGGPNGASYTAVGNWSLAADSTITINITGTGTSSTVTGHETAKYSSVTGTMTNGKTNYTNGNPETHSFTLRRVGDQ